MTKWCVKDGVCVCDKVEGQGWCVTKLCVKDGVSKMTGGKVVCKRWCVCVCVKDIV